MAEPQTMQAWCAGRPVEVSARPAPPDHRQVPCKACGAKRGQDCFDITSMARVPLYKGHASRQRARALLDGAERS